MERLRFRSTSLLDLQTELRQQELLEEITRRHGPMPSPAHRPFLRRLRLPGRTPPR